MNEELQKLATQVIKETLEAAIQVKDFVVVQAPDVIRQLLAWNLTMSLVQFAIVSMVLFCLFGSAFYINKRRPFSDRYSTDAEDERGVNPRDKDWNNRGAALGLSAIGAIVLICSLGETEWVWLKILVAPKLWLIEYAATLAK